MKQLLEKFVNLQLSLFVDTSLVRDFLLGGWKTACNGIESMPADSIVTIGSVLEELEYALRGAFASEYVPLIGDLRKVKRFINAIGIMQIEKSNLAKTDFNRRDLINLILIHLNYPGIFRKIYSEEMDGRSGIFSLRRDLGDNYSKNSPEFSRFLKEQEKSASFLLSQLFDVEVLGINNRQDLDEDTQALRACFNTRYDRSLEAYLKLIVHFVTPEPQSTLILYKEAVSKVQEGEAIASVLAAPDLDLKHGEHVHDQFWRFLVNRSRSFTEATVNDAIDTLIDFLPRYSFTKMNDLGLRRRSIYSLLQILDSAGWGREGRRRLPNSSENIIEIAWRIFGEKEFQGKGIIQRLSSSDRGVLGWCDLMWFRLLCSADRRGQLHNLYSSLVLHQDINAATSGSVKEIAIMGMRKISQEVFSIFKSVYIDNGINFISEVMEVPDDEFVIQFYAETDDGSQSEEPYENDGESMHLQISRARYFVRYFVIHELTDRRPPNGKGAGCGFYDEFSDGDRGGIADMMNDYMFGVCFNPCSGEQNLLNFVDHCLLNLSHPFYSDENEAGYVPLKAYIPGGLDPKRMGQYWNEYGGVIRKLVASIDDRKVPTINYVASYSEHLEKVFFILDELAGEAIAEDKAPQL